MAPARELARVRTWCCKLALFVACIAVLQGCGEKQAVSHDLAWYMDAFNDSRYHATYNFSSTFMGRPSGSIPGTIDVYKDGGSRERVADDLPQELSPGQGFFLDGRGIRCVPNIKAFVEKELRMKSSVDRPGCIPNANGHEMLL